MADDVKDAVKAALEEMQSEREAEWAKKAALTPTPSYEAVRRIARHEAQVWAYWALMASMVMMILRSLIRNGSLRLPGMIP